MRVITGSATSGVLSDRTGPKGRNRLTGRAGSLQDLRAMVERVRPVTTADEHVLPLMAGLEELFEGGLKRGATVVVDGGSGATTLALSLSARATSGGSWLGCLNMPSLGWASACELGVDLRRVVAVEVPQPELPAAAAAMVDVFDLVLCGTLRGLSVGQSRSLLAKARERGCVLLVLGNRQEGLFSGRSVAPDGSDAWHQVPDALVKVEGVTWSGLGSGTGRLRDCRIRVNVRGRRQLSRPRSVEIRCSEEPQSGDRWEWAS